MRKNTIIRRYYDEIIQIKQIYKNNNNSGLDDPVIFY